jgi:hypothetical protein
VARTRAIKPEFWDDEKLSGISKQARLFFIGMWTNSDDYGVIKGNPIWLKNKIFPYDDDKIKDIEKWLDELKSIDCIRHFKANSENFYWIRTFECHQVINRPSKAKNPQPPQGVTEHSRSTHGVLTDETETETETETILVEDSVEFRLSKLLYDKIKKRNNGHKLPNLKMWSKQIDLMIRIDKRKPDDIKEIILWCQSDPFWQNNILSTSKLRKQYDALFLKMRKENPKTVKVYI